MEDDIINEVVDQHYADAPLIDTNPETTETYNEEEEYDKRNEIEWKINKGVFFSRKERQSWHSYKGDNKSNRIALVYNLMTNRIKEVYRIENKNYFIGNLRFRLNPYLNRFFKFTL